MSGTVIAGILIALMFLVSFSQWFYHVVAGVDTLVLHDIFFYYRAATWAVGAILFMITAFWLIALFQECPLDQPRVGLFRYLNCNFYVGMRDTLARFGVVLPLPKQPFE